MKRLIGGNNMNNDIPLQNKQEQLTDIIEHKKFVFETIGKIALKLLTQGQDEMALEIMKRGFLHDISKLQNDEFYGMAEFAYDKDSLKNPKDKISDEKQNAINLHWNRNEHHPEYWTDISQMKDIDILELTCDFYSRSLQFGTNMLEFLEQRQKDRFHFPQDIYDKIVKYYYLIEEN